MKALLLTVLSSLFYLNTARSSPLLQSYIAQSGKCDGDGAYRVYDEITQNYQCIEHTDPVKRKITDFIVIATNVKTYLNTLSLISDNNKNQLALFFSKADKNQDGLISKEEMIFYVNSNNKVFSENDMNQAWVLFDSDADGNISVAEFTTAIEE